ncbi:uncharacterized protein TEOVI_000192800 [Trypanosoma equiperdum]|nr:hypothetical protein, conserved [Trypanosoma equiperdum]
MVGEDSNLGDPMTGPAVNLPAFQSLSQPGLFPRSIPPDPSLQCQVLAAEWCASLSIAMINLSSGDFSPSANSSSSSPKGGFVAAGLATTLFHDLSAHYGSHALRRGASHPLGPCYRSKKRSRAAGHHDGRGGIWSLRMAHRLWCRRCGLHLCPGKTKLLRSPCAPSVCSLEDSEGFVGGPAAGEASRANRGLYVCCRCLAAEQLRHKKEMGSFVQSCKERNVRYTNSEEEEEEGTHLSTSNHLAAAAAAAAVGRTRRRKRKRHNDDVVSGDRVSKDGQIASTVALRNLPKGSLVRGKRSRVTVPGALKALPPSLKNEQKTHGIGSIDEGRMTARKAARTETYGDVKRANHTQAGSEPPVSMTVELRQVTGAQPGPLRPLSRRGTAIPKKDGASNAKSNNAFSNTMSRLGL